MKKILVVWGAVFALVAAGQSVWAKDVLQEQVLNATPDAVISPNGTAVGTIHVVYTVNAFQFTPGSFGNFDIEQSILTGTDNPETTYPLTLSLKQKQEGTGNLILTPTTGSFTVAGSDWFDGTTVAIALPADLPDDDGTTVTGVLQFEASRTEKPTNPQFNTNTTVVVKVVLLHPTACLKAANFVTDNSYNALDGAVVNLKTKNGTTTVISTNPGQFADNLLVANNCDDDQVIDLKINLDGCFETNPSGNPGQAIFTYLTSGEVDEQNFDFSVFGNQVARGQNLCLAGLTIPAGQTLLATVHMGAVKGILSSALPADTSFDFGAAIFAIGSGGCTQGTLHALTDPNPVSATLSFTTK